MRLRLVSVIALLAALLPTTGAAGSAGAEVYTGTLQIKVAYWGPKCPTTLGPNPLRLQKTKTYRMPVAITRAPPARDDDGATEQNPFNFVISTAPPLREGGFTLTSATVLTGFDGRTLYESWRTSLQGGASIDGRFVRSYRAIGSLMILNALTTDRLFVPCRPDLGTQPKTFQPLREGARLRGTFTDRRVDLTLTGQTFDRWNRFTARIVASR